MGTLLHLCARVGAVQRDGQAGGRLAAVPGTGACLLRDSPGGNTLTTQAWWGPHRKDNTPPAKKSALIKCLELSCISELRASLGSKLGGPREGAAGLRR